MNRWLQVWNGILYPEFFTRTHTKYALILSRLNYFFTVYVSMMCRVMSPCSTKHALKPQIFKYFKYTLYGKRNFANMIKFENFSYGDYPGLLSGSNIITRVLLSGRRRSESERQIEDTTLRLWRWWSHNLRNVGGLWNLKSTRKQILSWSFQKKGSLILGPLTSRTLR